MESFGIFYVLLGEEIVAGDDLYGGTDRLLSQVTPKTGVVVKLVYLLILLVVILLLVKFEISMHENVGV